MAKFFKAATMCAVFFIAPATALADSNDGEQSNQITYDRKIEAAAIKRAAEKLGDLRGSLLGNERSFVTKETDLMPYDRKSLGFPRISEETTSSIEKKADKAVPMI